jgi:hypothetical protein
MHTISVHSKTIYLRRERLQDDIHKTAMFPHLGLRFADYGQTADIAITVDRPVMTFDWTYTLVYQPKSLTLASGTVEATDEFDAGPKLAAVIVEQLASAVQFPREELDRPTGISEANGTGIRESGSDPAGIRSIDICGIPHDLDEGQFAAGRALHASRDAGVGHPHRRRPQRGRYLYRCHAALPDIRLDFQND